jgi:hypothetical protein
MKPCRSLPFTSPEIPHEISAWPHPGFSREGRRIFGIRTEEDGVMPLFYRQRLHEGIALQRALATNAAGGDRP